MPFVQLCGLRRASLLVKQGAPALAEATQEGSREEILVALGQAEAGGSHGKDFIADAAIHLHHDQFRAERGK